MVHHQVRTICAALQDCCIFLDATLGQCLNLQSNKGGLQHEALAVMALDRDRIMRAPSDSETFLYKGFLCCMGCWV